MRGGGGAGAKVIVKLALPVPVRLVALILTEKVPLAAGIPLINPVAVFTLRPAGNPAAANAVGLLVAAIW